jgi:NAD-dependent dihydropyrimidine dehydrogenase PreA subunit
MGDSKGLSYRQVRVGRFMSGIQGLDEIFTDLYSEGRSPDPSLKEELLERVRVHNYVPSSSGGEYATAFLREYESFCRQRESLGEEVSPASQQAKGRPNPRYRAPWFPTVDEDLCDGCGRCLDFCSHGVFAPSGDGGAVQVLTPLNCVVGCDACTRICPRQAIIFPPRTSLRGVTGV